jgi:FxsC-like protein
MSGTHDSHNQAVQDGSYFFLSYAHSPPLAGTRQADPDQWVRRFYRDLSDSVDDLASQPRHTSGFFDQDIAASANWKASLTRALGAAQVFVPLLSPGYFARAWPGREWACFSARLNLAGVADPDQRFAPVLWIPLQGNQERPGLRAALALGASESAYAENGLRALLRLSPYRTSYRLIVARLAKQIVDLAERAPLAPSDAPDVGEVPSAFHPGADAAVFAVTVAAPTLAALPDNRDRAEYGSAATDWRAYPDDQALPLAEYAAQVAEQLDFAVVVAGIEGSDGLPGNMPGVILIDPWFAADEVGRNTLRSFTVDLPPWVLPVLVIDSPADRRTAELADRVRIILAEAVVTRTETARLATRGVSSLKEFVALMPILVAEAERQYLRRGPIQRYKARPGSRPRLADVGWPLGQAPPQPSEEQDA